MLGDGSLYTYSEVNLDEKNRISLSIKKYDIKLDEKLVAVNCGKYYEIWNWDDFFINDYIYDEEHNLKIEYAFLINTDIKFSKGDKKESLRLCLSSFNMDFNGKAIVVVFGKRLLITTRENYEMLVSSSLESTGHNILRKTLTISPK